MTMANNTEKELEQIGLNVCDKILIPQYNKLGLRASGNWARSLESKAIGNTINIMGADYTYYMMHGRASGKQPPIQAIALWLKQRGIQANPYAVAKTIAKKGTKTYQKRGNDLLSVLDESKNKQEIGKQIGQIVVNDSIEKIINTLKKAFNNGNTRA